MLMYYFFRFKVRTPYERHYLLLGAVHTQFVLLQSKFNRAFKGIHPLEVLEKYSTTKLRAILQILRRFDLTRPVEPVRPKRIVVNDDEDDDDKDGCDDEMERYKPQVVQNTKSNRGRRRKNFKLDPTKNGKSGNDKNTKDAEAGVETEAVGELIKQTVENGTIRLVASENSENNLKDESVEKKAKIKPEIELNAAEGIKPESSEDKQADRPKNRRRYNRKAKLANKSAEPPLCGILFVESRFDARML